MKRLLLVAGVLGLVLAACGGSHRRAVPHIGVVRPGPDLSPVSAVPVSAARVHAVAVAHRRQAGSEAEILCDQSVSQCADDVPPSQRFDLPLVVAEPGATLQGMLGFVPSSVQIVLLDRRGAAVYSQTLSAAQSFSWTVPASVPARTWLVIAAGRPGFPGDSATYLARLQPAS